MPVQPVFEVADGGFVATPLASGPWNQNVQIGGAPAALLARAFERVPAAEGLTLARLTYDFIRPARIGPLQAHAEVARPGRRVQLLDGSMVADGVEVVRARALRVMTAECGGGHSAEIAPPPGPQGGRVRELPGLHRPRFATDAVEVRFIHGGFGSGPATAWFRLAIPLVGNEQPSALQRLAAASDFGAGLSGDAPTRGLPVHQPRPDAVRRARAGRRVDLPRVPDAARPGGHRRCRKRALRRARPRRPGHPGAASRAPLRRRRADRTAVRPPPESPARARRSRWPT